jgi:hypothetical protein
MTLAEEGGLDVLVRTAGSPNTPGGLIAALAGIGDEFAQDFSDKGRESPPSRLDIIRVRAVRAAAAGNPAAPPPVLSELASDPAVTVRARAAANPAAPEEALRRLASDPEPLVRRSLGAGEGATPEILSLLLSDEDPWVRLGVSQNPQTAMDSLAVLAEDLSDAVRRQALISMRRLFGGQS